MVTGKNNVPNEIKNTNNHEKSKDGLDGFGCISNGIGNRIVIGEERIVDDG